MSTPYTDTGLKAEITTDPLALGYAAPVAAGSDGAVAELLNDRTRGFTVAHTAPWSAVLKWMAQNGFRSKLQDASTTAGGANRDVALAILDLIHGAADGFDTTDPGTVALFSAIVPAAQQPALVALGSVPASRAEVLWGYGTVISPNNVSKAMRGQS